MLEWIRGARVNRKTAMVVVLIALAAWAIVVYVIVLNVVGHVSERRANVASEGSVEVIEQEARVAR